MVTPSISWWFPLSPWVAESGSVETDPPHSDDQVSTRLRNSKICKTVSVLEPTYLSKVLTTLYIGCIQVNSLSHEDLSFSGIRVTGEASCDALHKLSTTATQDLPLLECKIFNSMTVRVPTHVLACGAIYSMGALCIHVSCMQSNLGNPNPDGSQRLQGLFTCARPDRAIQTTCMNSLVTQISLRMDNNSLLFMGSTYVTH